MKNMRWLVIFGLLAMVMASMSALAEMDTTVHGEVRMRAENVDNYFDFDDDGRSGFSNNDSFSFAPFRVRLGVGVSFGDKVYGYISIQEGDIFGQDDVVQGDRGNLNETDEDDGDLVMYQGYVKMNEVGGTSLDLKFGRQEYVQGNELLFGDLDFYNGISFDGVRARWDLELGPLDVIWFRVVEDLFGDDDTDIVGVEWNLVDIMPNGELAFYGYYVNSDSGVADAFDDDDVHLDFAMIGARAGQDHVDESGFIWSAEGVYQFGDLECRNSFCDVVDLLDGDDIDIKAYAFEGMFGYNLAKDGNHRFFGTVYISSGDDDHEDGDYEVFHAPFQDFHRRNGAADVFSSMGNLTSFSIGWDWQGEKNGVHVELFSFSATEEGSDPLDDLDFDSTVTAVDVGSGNGLPGDSRLIGLGDEDDLGTEIDIIYTYQVNEYFGFEAGVAVFQPGDAIKDFTKEFTGKERDDDISRIWGQARLRW